MQKYKFYPINDAGHIVGPPHSVEAVDDAEALEIARSYLSECDLEGWQDKRLLGIVKRSKP